MECPSSHGASGECKSMAAGWLDGVLLPLLSTLQEKKFVVRTKLDDGEMYTRTYSFVPRYTQGVQDEYVRNIRREWYGNCMELWNVVDVAPSTGFTSFRFFSTSETSGAHETTIATTNPDLFFCIYKLNWLQLQSLFIGQNWHLKKPKTEKSKSPIPPCLGPGVSSLRRKDSHPGPSWYCAWHLLQPEHHGIPLVPRWFHSRCFSIGAHFLDGELPTHIYFFCSYCRIWQGYLQFHLDITAAPQKGRPQTLPWCGNPSGRWMKNSGKMTVD